MLDFPKNIIMTVIMTPPLWPTIILILLAYWHRIIFTALHQYFLWAITYMIETLNSHAVGMDVAQPLGFEIDFARYPISGSAAWFFIIILKLIFTPIFEIKVHEKNSWHRKKNIFEARLLVSSSIGCDNADKSVSLKFFSVPEYFTNRLALIFVRVSLFRNSLEKIYKKLF